MSYQKIETTFGVVTIFKNKPDDEPEIIESTELKTESRTDTKLKSQIESSKNENFFGLETEPMPSDKEDTTSKSNDLDNLNYIDEQLLGVYKDKQQSIDLTNMKENIKITDTNLNYIDTYYFTKNDNKKNENKQELTKEENITTKHIESNTDLNFIDQMMLKPSKEEDKTIGSITSFKVKTKKEPKQIQTEIPIISSNNINDEEYNMNKFKNILKSEQNVNNNENKKVSSHKVLENEVPSWYNLTVDEGAAILKNHICYLNEEQGLLCIDKPYGLPCIGGAKVHLSVARILPALQRLLNLNKKPFMAHRLDGSTTGVMLFGLNEETAKKLQNLFAERKMIKQYLAITKNVPKENTGEIDIPLIRRTVNRIEKTYLSPEYNDQLSTILDKPNENDARKAAITKYRLLDTANQSSLLEIQPLTGFQHQIRAHLAYGLGCPILGDHKYSHDVKMAPQKLPDEMLKQLNIKQTKVRYVPMHLHSYRIILPEFWKNSNVFITAKLPLHFINNLKRLKLKF